jgi:hypothetical protein
VQVDDLLQAEESAYQAEEAKLQKARKQRGSTHITADGISSLLAAAPPLVDLLIQECCIRCTTLVVRDVVNLNIAAGGKLQLAPIWEPLAAQINR